MVFPEDNNFRLGSNGFEKKWESCGAGSVTARSVEFTRAKTIANQKQTNKQKKSSKQRRYVREKDRENRYPHTFRKDVSRAMTKRERERKSEKTKDNQANDESDLFLNVPRPIIDRIHSFPPMGPVHPNQSL